MSETVYQSNEAKMLDALERLGYDRRDPALRDIIRLTHSLVADSWRYGRDGNSLNEAHP